MFFHYLGTKKNILIAAALVMACYVAVFALYGAPAEAVLYPTLLSFLAILGFVIADYLKVRSKHNRLSKLSDIPSEMLDDIPPGETIPEEDYLEIIESLRAENRKRSEQAFEKYSAMTDYYTIWAHQIKTPISVMKLMLEKEDSPLSRSLSGEVLRTQQYVDMVLAFIRLESSSTDYVISSFDLGEVVRASVRKFASEFILRKLRIELLLEEKKILSDEKWFSFVIEQILSNSLKYTKEGGIRIYMADETTLCIEDTGMGIASSDLPRIMERGYTGYNGRSDKQASGLGLFLCKKICDKFGHSVRIESEVGKGTSVYIGNLSDKAKKYE